MIQRTDLQEIREFIAYERREGGQRDFICNFSVFQTYLYLRSTKINLITVSLELMQSFIAGGETVLIKSCDAGRELLNVNLVR
jgi:hypothetical protein